MGKQTKSPSAGDKVVWETEGKVIKKVTKPTTIKGYTAKASPDEPQVLVESSKTGKRAVHKPASLKKAT